MSTQADIGRQTKVIVAIIAVVLVGGGYLAYTWFQNHNATNSSIRGITTNAKGTKTEESEQYRQVLNRYNQTNAQQAESSGGSYMSVMSAQSVKPETNSATPQQQPQQVTYYYQQPQQQQQVVTRNKEYDKQVADQVKGLMTAWVEKPHSSVKVSEDEAYTQSIMPSSLAVAGVSGASNQPAGNGTATAKAPDVVVIPGFTLAPSILKTEIDTDENSMVRAEIAAGPFAGAVCFAMGYKRINETVDMTFSYMEWKGHSYKINAKAVDPDSMRTALSGEVNNRYFQRIILPALAVAIGKTGQLYQQSSAQNIITSEGAVIQTYPETPDGAAVAGTFVGGIGQQAGKVLANDAANMPQKQVIRPLGTTIGIQFIGPVMASDALDKNAIQANQKDELNTLSQPAGQPKPQYRLSPSATGSGDEEGMSGSYPGYTPGLGQPNTMNSTRY
uniref:Conjugal transfer protein TraO n=1 Tax=Pseudomonas fluorescens TaxID=294 RepID=A0A2S1PJ80_PSEFL|nr:conjugal transfer protein TraO [Pseudomonas fluorescens]AWH58529.1 Putative conjugal transfer protein TraO [Pseudomonas fluorescens]